MSNQESDNSGDIIFAGVAIFFIVGFGGLMTYFIWENEQEGPIIEAQKEWLKNEANCEDLKNFIIEDIEGKEDHNILNLRLAKQLHEWKCEK